jgi:hypothetical protein
MVTGDQAATARAIAKEAGILSDAESYREDTVIEGHEFFKRIRADRQTLAYDKDAFRRLMDRVKVMARCQPEHKEFFVRGLIDEREIVAVTGDGTNDAPALATADVGFAMGIAGTKVAKAASAIVVMDDNFATIVKAIKWGRNVYDAIQKFLVFQLTVNIVAVILVLVCACVAGQTPLGALQLLWVNMIMDTLASLALATEAPRDKLMERRPYERDSSVVSKAMLRQMLGHSLYQLIIMFLLSFYGHEMFDVSYGLEPEEACQEGKGLVHLTIVFNTFVWMQLFNEINSRRIDSERNVFEGLHKNTYFLVIMVIQIFGQVIITEFGGDAFKLSDGLNAKQWGGCLGFGVGSLFVHQLILCVDVEIIPDWMEALFVIPVEDDESDDDAPRTAPSQSLETGNGPMRTRSVTMDSINSIKKAASKDLDSVSSTGSVGSSRELSAWDVVRNKVLKKNLRSMKDGKYIGGGVSSLRQQLGAASVDDIIDGPARRAKSLGSNSIGAASKWNLIRKRVRDRQVFDMLSKEALQEPLTSQQAAAITKPVVSAPAAKTSTIVRATIV